MHVVDTPVTYRGLIIELWQTLALYFSLEKESLRALVLVDILLVRDRLDSGDYL